MKIIMSKPVETSPNQSKPVQTSPNQSKPVQTTADAKGEEDQNIKCL